jgi:hypothetical protein
MFYMVEIIYLSFLNYFTSLIVEPERAETAHHTEEEAQARPNGCAWPALAQHQSDRAMFGSGQSPMLWAGPFGGPYSKSRFFKEEHNYYVACGTEFIISASSNENRNIHVEFVSSLTPIYSFILAHDGAEPPPPPTTQTQGEFGWVFQPAFAFAKAKSQPKGPKATATFAQSQLLV